MPETTGNVRRERGILMSAPMVRALLAGQKTQTRREIKSQPPEDCGRIVVETFHPTRVNRWGEEEPGAPVFGAYSMCGEWGARCPYGQPGDRLWVREAWRVAAVHDHVPGSELFFSPMPRVQYDADGRDETGKQWGRYRAGRFMPRAASRITLEITGVRVERLQDISEAGAWAEGIPGELLHRAQGWAPRAYQLLVSEIHGGPAYWDSNPWVWVVEFKRVPQ